MSNEEMQEEQKLFAYIQEFNDSLAGIVQDSLNIVLYPVAVLKANDLFGQKWMIDSAFAGFRAKIPIEAAVAMFILANAMVFTKNTSTLGLLFSSKNRERNLELKKITRFVSPTLDKYAGKGLDARFMSELKKINHTP